MKAERQRIKKQLAVVLAVAVLGAAVTGALLTWDQRTAPPPERVVTIYRTHGCTCAFPLAESLTVASQAIRK